MTVPFVSCFSGLRAALDHYFQISRTQEPSAGPGPHQEIPHTARDTQEQRPDETIEVIDSDSSTSGEEEEEQEQEEEAVEAAAPLLPSAQETPPAVSSGGLCCIGAV